MQKTLFRQANINKNRIKSLGNTRNYANKNISQRIGSPHLHRVILHQVPIF